MQFSKADKPPNSYGKTEKFTLLFKRTYGSEDLSLRCPAAAAQQQSPEDVRQKRPHSVSFNNLQEQTQFHHVAIDLHNISLLLYSRNTPYSLPTVLNTWVDFYIQFYFSLKTIQRFQLFPI